MADIRTIAAAQPVHALVPVEVTPVAEAKVPAIIAAPVPTAVSRETIAHGVLTLGTLIGGGAMAYLGTSTAGLVAMGAAALASIAITASRAFTGRGSTQELIASLANERQALNVATDLVMRERATLDHQRHHLSQLAAEEAERRMAPMLAELEAQRAALHRERAAFEQRTNDVREALAKEAAALTPDEITAITTAVQAYNKSSNNVAYRIVGDVYTGGFAPPHQRMIAAEKVLATLVGTGKVVAGACTNDPSSSRFFVVPAEGATVITSVAQLRLFLRTATGQNV